MPTIKTNEIFANRYKLIKQLGIGGYSEVWLAEDQYAGNMEVAVKIYAPGKGLDEDGLKTFGKEYTTVFNLNNAHLLKPMHYDVCEGSPYLVLQYCKNGSLYKKIGKFTEADVAGFLHESCEAIAYLHKKEPPIIHQDIKPDNFLIDEDGNYLLADFGISSKIRRTLTRSIGEKASTGTMAYMPPEKFNEDRQAIKAGDIFSLGVCMFELLTGELAFGDLGGLALKSGADLPKLPNSFSTELNSIIRSCLAKDPWDRPTAESLVEIAKNYKLNGKWDITKLPIAKKEVYEEPIIIPKEPEKPRARETVQLPVNDTENKKEQPTNKPLLDSLGKPLLYLGIVIALFFTTIYFVKTYDTDAVEIVKDENISTYGSFTDSRDGQVYKTVKIGNQTWMAENLAYTGNNGFQRQITDNKEWENSNYDGWCYYDNDASNGEKYGVLYQWEAAIKACPEGWHLPSDDDWKVLTDYLGGEVIAGGKLKEAGFTNWKSPNEAATNESNFSALPGGVRYFNGSFSGIGGGCNWWSSTVFSSSNARNTLVSFIYSNAFRDDIDKTTGSYVRCLMD